MSRSSQLQVIYLSLLHPEMLLLSLMLLVLLTLLLALLTMLVLLLTLLLLLSLLSRVLVMALHEYVSLQMLSKIHLESGFE